MWSVGRCTAPSAGPRSYGRDWAAVQMLSRRMALMALLAGAILPSGMPALAADAPARIVALGDSLTAGFGLPADAAFPVRLQKALIAKGLAVEIANAGVSGDTMSGGLARLDWSVPESTQAVILELGANDMLRGLDPQVTRKALEEILRRLGERHIEVLLCGMVAARNLGDDYASPFNRMYPELAARDHLLLYPFFLEGVLGQARLEQAQPGKALVQPDGVHPTAAGVDVIVAGILPTAEQLVARVRSRRGS
jgi:acyl-CoA thioesterase-1